MSYLRSFAPWIIFALVSLVDWRFGALAGVLSSAVVLGRAHRRGEALDGQILELSSTVFFVLLTVVAFADPHSALKGWAAAASLLWLAATAWLSLAVARPFTLGIARQTVPQSLWGNPVFRQVNMVITAVWAATFTVIGIGTALCQTLDAPGVVSVGIHFGYIVPIVFTRRYPDVVRARYAAARQGA